MFSRLCVATIDEDERDDDSDACVQREHGEANPWAERASFAVLGEDLASRFHGDVRSDRGLPGIWEELDEHLGYEQQRKQGCDRTGRCPDDGAEAETEQTEHGEVEAASNKCSYDTRVTD